MIDPESHFQVFALVVGVSAFSFWVDRTRISAFLPGLTAAIFLSMLLSNVGIAPRSAPAYGIISSYLIPVAVSLMLLQADLGRILRETRGMLTVFAFGALGAALGALLGVVMFPLGGSAPELAGVFSATYIGGSMNMAAVAEAVDLDKSVLSASVAADNVVTVAFLLLLTAAPNVKNLVRWFGCAREVPSPSVVEEAQSKDGRSALSLLSVSLALFIALSVCAAANYAAVRLSLENYSILFVTIFSVLIANLAPKRLLQHEAGEFVGVFFMYMFFSVVGAGADLFEMFNQARHIVLYAAFIVTVHLLFVAIAGRVFRVGLEEMIIASNACISGPGTAAALAAGKHWRHLVTPGVLCGVLGYAAGNFIGIGVWKFLS